MTSSKHPHGGPNEEGLGDGIPRPPSDEKRNPGIGSSKGVFGRGTDPSVLQADNTDEGDVGNGTNAQGGIDREHIGQTRKPMGRTNK